MVVTIKKESKLDKTPPVEILRTLTKTLTKTPPIKIFKTLPNLEQWYDEAKTPHVEIFRTLAKLEQQYKAIL